MILQSHGQILQQTSLTTLSRSVSRAFTRSIASLTRIVSKACQTISSIRSIIRSRPRPVVHDLPSKRTPDTFCGFMRTLVQITRLGFNYRSHTNTGVFISGSPTFHFDDAVKELKDPIYTMSMYYCGSAFSLQDPQLSFYTSLKCVFQDTADPLRRRRCFRSAFIRPP